jgi:hypothetical protein
MRKSSLEPATKPGHCARVFTEEVVRFRLQISFPAEKYTVNLGIMKQRHPAILVPGIFLLTLVFFPESHAKILIRAKSETSILSKLKAKSKLKLFGQSYTFDTFCSKDTSATPETLEVYEISGQRGKLLFFCFSEMDDEINKVTLVLENRNPLTKELLPTAGTFRLSKEKLEKTVSELLKSSK